MTDKQNVLDLLFEVSWEVCNKVGGIYTVLSTKANTLMAQKNVKQLIFIGPDVWSPDNICPVFTPKASLLSGWRKNAQLPEGLSVRVGTWNIPGNPTAILVDFKGMFASKDAAYGHLWEAFGVDSLHAYGDYDEACAFARAASAVIASIVEYKGLDKLGKDGLPIKNVVAHFDEWTTGAGLLDLRLKVPSVASVFTTHATSIGRSICSNGKPLYDYFSGYNGDQMAGELNMQSKHSLEKAAATNADAFTTVSDITAEECAQLLDKPVSVVTPNGFENDFVPAAPQLRSVRDNARTTIRNVASALTGKVFDDNCFIVATSGRCEFRNKGIDVFLDALKQMSTGTQGRQILALVLVPSWQAGPRADLQARLSGNNNAPLPLPDPVITHNLHNYNEDAIIGRIHALGLGTDNNVSVIFVPCYLDGRDGIFNIHYYDLLPGLDATVFPSYYEPWGYTPLESVAFGVPTITTSLSGFGRWVLKYRGASLDKTGVAVVPRTDSNYAEVVASIADIVTSLSALPANEVKRISKAAEKTAEAALWSEFIDAYNTAYDKAIACRNARLV